MFYDRMNELKIVQNSIQKQCKTLPAVRYNIANWMKQGCPQQTVSQDRPVSNVCANILKSLMHSETVLSRTALKDRTTGKTIPAYITKFEREGNKYLYLKDENANKLGYAVAELPQRGYFKAPIGDDYIYNSMELTALESVNKGNKQSPYRGIGTELLKAAVRESKKSGFNGRIHLMAYDSHPPTPFYFKCGLRFVQEDKNKLMEEYLKNSKTQNIKLPENLESGLMYLPDENIEKLLSL